jgi:hypothetical protein
MESVWSPSVFGPSVRVVLGLCTDLAQTQLGRRWLVKQNIHQNSVRVQSEHSPWIVHGLHGARTESMQIRWGSVKTSHIVLIQPSLHSCITDTLKVKRFCTKSHITTLNEKIFPERNLPNYFSHPRVVKIPKNCC